MSEIINLCLLALKHIKQFSIKFYCRSFHTLDKDPLRLGTSPTSLMDLFYYYYYDLSAFIHWTNYAAKLN